MSIYQEINTNIYVKYKEKELVKKGCAGKRVYNSFGQAKEIADYRAKIIGEDLGPYKCKWCSYIHIGHPFGSERNMQSKVECPYGCEEVVYRSKLNEHFDECPSYTE